jgi:hypothetical protein
MINVFANFAPKIGSKSDPAFPQNRVGNFAPEVCRGHRLSEQRARPTDA